MFEKQLLNAGYRKELCNGMGCNSYVLDMYRDGIFFAVRVTVGEIVQGHFAYYDKFANYDGRNRTVTYNNVDKLADPNYIMRMRLWLSMPENVKDILV